MTTIEKPREAELNVTGYCKHRNHKKCPYRAGGATENGIALSDGGFYMCPCDCHAEQAVPVKLKAKRLAQPAAPEPEWSGLKGTDSPNYYGPVQHAAAKVAAALDNNRDELEAVIEKQAAKPKAERPAKSPKKATAPKAAPKPKAEKPSAAPTKLGNAEKQAVRTAMAAVLREAFSADELMRNPGGELDGIPAELIIAYLEDHWLRYIDPDLDKARREAAAAAWKGK